MKYALRKDKMSRRNAEKDEALTITIQAGKKVWTKSRCLNTICFAGFCQKQSIIQNSEYFTLKHTFRNQNCKYVAEEDF